MRNKSVGYTESANFSCLEDLEQTYTMKTITPVTLAYCGRENCAPEWTFGPYAREHYVIHVVKAGCGTYSLRNREFRLTAGQMFLIYPGEVTLYKADAEDPWSYSWIGFSGYKADAIVEDMGFTKENPVITLDSTQPVCDSIDRILEASDLTPANELKRMAAFYDTLAVMIEMNPHEKKRSLSDVKYVNMAVEYIAANYSGKIRISEIADKVGINRSYLSNIFSREMHMSPQEFLINFRLEKAAQMLRETEESIGSIASSVGYTDPLTFSKAFRKKYNDTPSGYRASSPELTQISERGQYHGNTRL